MQELDENAEEERQVLLGSLLEFTKVFYKLRTGRMFNISDPIGRESHIITIMRELVKVSRLETNNLLINVPPGHGKSEILIHFVAWSMAMYPDSNFLYISYSKDIAQKHTATIRQIMELSHYRKLFGVELRKDSSAKDNFKTTNGGAVVAFGSSGSITGQDAGLPDLDRFSGGVVMDDMHKPDEVHSDTMRSGVTDNYNQTIKPRRRGVNVPFIFIGQRLHEDDLPAYLISGKDGFSWKKVILKAIDEAGNVLHPTVNPRQMLLREQETNPYVFSSQYQQDPQPSGGGIFKKEWFTTKSEEPNFISTFITTDTAETDKNYNDATVFSFWGLYKLSYRGEELDDYAIHLIDCLEVRVEPKDLEQEFLDFYAGCMRHSIKPKTIAIEKKSTGVTLSSVLSNLQGIRLLNIERTKASGSKTKRFLEMQPYIASKQLTLPQYGKHTDMFITHMSKITANDTHRWDDICDTAYDAIKLALIDKIFIGIIAPNKESSDIVKQLSIKNQRLRHLRKEAYGRITDGWSK